LINLKHLQEALDLGIIDIAENENGVKNADLIIVAIPVDATVKILPQVLDLISEKQTVMDVGSTKSGIVEAIKNHPKRNRYVVFTQCGEQKTVTQNLHKRKFFGKSCRNL
jgi:prephenate dehydrogenase